MESLINPEDNSTNLIYRFADMVFCLLARYSHNKVRRHCNLSFLVRHDVG